MTEEYPLSFLVEVITEPKEIFRVCKAATRDDEEQLIVDLQSNYQRKPNKIRLLDAHATVIQMGLSMWDNFEDASKMSRKLPQHLGEYVARLEVVPDYGICIAQTGFRTHHTVWGRPPQLLEFVQEVVPA